MIRFYVVVALLGVPGLAQADGWPSFRGEFASGVREGMELPEEFDGEK